VAARDSTDAPDRPAIRIVLVDDNPGFSEAAREVLQRGGLAVLAIACSGHQAVEVVARCQPDVVLVDVFLGEESGFDVARQLALITDAKIVLISAHAEDDLIELVAGSEAIGFVPKAQLSATAIRNLLTEPDEQSP
jgi:DNA-binding NarL/FixJ family response regulator